MPPADTSHTVPPRPSHHFETTNWTLVRQAASEDEAVAAAALETLCKAYWLPVYAYIRSRGRSETDAEDLTQGVFQRLLKQKAFAKAGRSPGKLRSYLLVSVRNYLASDYERETAWKRGGGAVHFSLDTAWAESTLEGELADDRTPDRIYQHVWARTILDFSLQLLEEEYASDGKAEEFDLLRPTLGFTTVPNQSYADLAARTGVSADAWKMRVHRFRKRWKEVFRRQVAMTLGDASKENIKMELAELIDLL